VQEQIEPKPNNDEVETLLDNAINLEKESEIAVADSTSTVAPLGFTNPKEKRRLNTRIIKSALNNIEKVNGNYTMDSELNQLFILADIYSQIPSSFQELIRAILKKYNSEELLSTIEPSLKVLSIVLAMDYPFTNHTTHWRKIIKFYKNMLFESKRFTLHEMAVRQIYTYLFSKKDDITTYNFAVIFLHLALFQYHGFPLQLDPHQTRNTKFSDILNKAVEIYTSHMKNETDSNLKSVKKRVKKINSFYATA
jgi:hypothetical protein